MSKKEALFDVLESGPIYFNVTDKEARIFGVVLFGVAGFDMLATSFLTIITFVSKAVDGMKLCQKLLVYNLLVPDFILEVLILYYFAPASMANAWQEGQMDTVWLAFLHTVSIFHGHLATAAICYIIALSMTDAYMYEMANDLKHMSVVVLSTIAVTISLCSLPATEDQGYALLENWLSPSFNVHYEYGSIFMCLGIMGLACIIELSSIYKLIQARRFYQEYRVRTAERALEELEQDLVFIILSLVTACLSLPALVGVPEAFLMFLPRLLVYACPTVRVLVLLLTCPHFQFAFFGQTLDIDDLAELEGLEEDFIKTKVGKTAQQKLVSDDMKSMAQSTTEL
ncbi:hypothetical protein PoB_003165700 [Plakobranchus ocellatus]|uniref:G protein-coupled receptor n=1 Tax=Plakobranchus ocellatus TaxID=259542 RepID=A0AAV4AD07_9GAST|nr:hypothetical protein PoB_003165700 [Plakobranchus ocellatus]